MTAKGEVDEIASMLAFVPELQSAFNVKEKIGEGTFSKVYRASLKNHPSDKEYALKYLIPTSRPSRIASELQCLKDVGGSCNVVGLELCLMHQGHVVIVMPYFPHERFVEYVKFLSTADIREYMRNLFVALEKIHAHGIIHRDVKPNNFLCDRFRKRYTLVDFGLAQRMENGHIMFPTPHSTSQPFKDHNASSTMPTRTNKTEAQYPSYASATEKSSYQSAAFSMPMHPSSNLDQENGGSLTKPKALDVRLNESGVPVCLKTNILPTPPQTPSSRYCQSLAQVSSISRDTSRNPPPLKKARKESNSKHVCSCFGEDVVCKICLGRPAEEAPRGGTPGFRAPEVLLKHRDQSTAVDMWSAGIILLSMLSQKYPFFRAEDDLSSLAEIVFLVGTEEMKNAALTLGKSVTLNLPGFAEVSKIRQLMTPSKYLKAVCNIFLEDAALNSDIAQRLQPPSTSKGTKLGHVLQDMPDSAYDLLDKLLDPNPATRITASQALAHPFLNGG